MIRTRHWIPIVLFLAGAVSSASESEEDREILRDLEFFKSFHLIKTLDETLEQTHAQKGNETRGKP